MTGGLLSDVEVAQALGHHPAWRRQGTTLVRELQMRDFDDAIAFIERVAGAAVDYRRRPDMCISENNRVRLVIWNLNHAGFTLAEVRLARKVDAILGADHPGAGTP